MMESGFERSQVVAALPTFGAQGHKAAGSFSIVSKLLISNMIEQRLISSFGAVKNPSGTIVREGFWRNYGQSMVANQITLCAGALQRARACLRP
jgi:hypothetical protein